MTEQEYQLAVMDDDGFGCAITTTPVECKQALRMRQPPFGVPVLRDDNGEPIMREVIRSGRVRYEYIWDAA